MPSNCGEISTLVKKVKKIKLKTKTDVLEVVALSELIFEEWAKLRATYRKKLMRNTPSNMRLYFEYEAEEEIVVGLLEMLNQKIINYILSASK